MSWLSSDGQEFLERTSKRRSIFRSRFNYFYQEDVRFLERIIPRDSRVLLVGCDVSDLAKSLAPRSVSVLELDGASPAELKQSVPFDYVVLPYTLSYLTDIQQFLELLKYSIDRRTRVVFLQYNFLWTPFYKVFEHLALKAPSKDLNWLSKNDLHNLLDLTDFEIIFTGAHSLIPIKIPLLSSFVNRILAPLPGLQWACLRMHVVARPRPGAHHPPPGECSVSVVVPARNEAGNIKTLLDRLPVMGNFCEVIFVEGHSKDNTWQEIQSQIATHPRRQEFVLKQYQQTGEGKADAMQLGYAKADGDVLIVLDADLSVQPEDLPHFYQALMRGSAEFLNGSRLVYNMDQHAMQILNLFFNKVFGALVSWLIGQPVKDTLCGTKVIFRSDYERLQKNFPEFNRLDPFGDFRLLFGAALLNLKICDVPVRYKERTYGSTNIRRFRHVWQLLKMCLKCRPYLK